MSRKNKLFFVVHETIFNSDKIIFFTDNFTVQTVKK